jgi:hypothetical protein
LFGAEKAGCKDIGNKTCCGYGAPVKDSDVLYACGYIMCREGCGGAFKMDLAMCVPAQASISGEKDGETL